MRRIFRRNLGVSPGGYRSRFGTTGIDHRAPESDLVDHGRPGQSGTRAWVDGPDAATSQANALSGPS
jgi:hypothetical protein